MPADTEVRLYIVTKEGIEIRGIVGVFEDRERACAAAEVKLREEHDDYHKFVVYEMPLNKTVKVRKAETDAVSVVSLYRTGVDMFRTDR